MQQLNPIQQKISVLQQSMFQHVQECKHGDCKTIGGWAIFHGEYFQYISSGLPGQKQIVTQCPLGNYLNEQMFELNQIQRYNVGESAKDYWLRKKYEDNIKSSSMHVWPNSNDATDMPLFIQALPVLKNLYNNQQQQEQPIIEDPHKGPKKIPQDERKVEMVNHVQNCKHPGCLRVWSGPWGTFIGGKDGAEYFDFTQCNEGKKINLAVGWKY